MRATLVVDVPAPRPNGTKDDRREDSRGRPGDLATEDNTPEFHFPSGGQSTFVLHVFPWLQTFHGSIANAIRARESPYCPREFADLVLATTVLSQKKTLRIYEVGPHFGDCLFWAAAFLGCENVRAYGFDIDLKVVQVVRRSIKSNGFGKCVKIRLAAIQAMDWGGRGRFLPELEEHQSSSSSVVEQSATAGQRTTPGGKKKPVAGSKRSYVQSYIKSLDGLIFDRQELERAGHQSEDGVDGSVVSQLSLRERRSRNESWETTEQWGPSHGHADTPPPTLLKVHVVGDADTAALVGSQRLLRSVDQVLVHADTERNIVAAIHELSKQKFTAFQVLLRDSTFSDWRKLGGYYRAYVERRKQRLPDDEPVGSKSERDAVFHNLLNRQELALELSRSMPGDNAAGASTSSAGGGGNSAFESSGVTPLHRKVLKTVDYRALTEFYFPLHPDYLVVELLEFFTVKFEVRQVLAGKNWRTMPL